MRKIILFVALLLTIPMVAQVRYTKYQSETVDNSAKLFITPLVADAQVIPNAPQTFSFEGEISYSTSNPNIEDINHKVNELKTRALYDYMESTGASAIASPIFKITTLGTSSGRTQLSIQIKGIPVRYVNYRTLSEKDAELVKISRFIDDNKNVQILNASQRTVNTNYRDIYE